MLSWQVCASTEPRVINYHMQMQILRLDLLYYHLCFLVLPYRREFQNSMHNFLFLDGSMWIEHHMQHITFRISPHWCRLFYYCQKHPKGQWLGHSIAKITGVVGAPPGRLRRALERLFHLLTIDRHILRAHSDIHWLFKNKARSSTQPVGMNMNHTATDDLYITY